MRKVLRWIILAFAYLLFWPFLLFTDGVEYAFKDKCLTSAQEVLFWICAFVFEILWLGILIALFGVQ